MYVYTELLRVRVRARLDEMRGADRVRRKMRCETPAYIKYEGRESNRLHNTAVY